MRALVRNLGETITEYNGVIGIDWETGAPLTNPSWAGGPYVLVEDYQESMEDTEEPQPIQSTPSAEQSSETLTETVTYRGREYTLEELKKLIG